MSDDNADLTGLAKSQPAMPRVIYYDYQHCCEFLARRGEELRETAKGLETLALYRELFYSFSYEAIEQQAIILGQFDAGIVYLFIPQEISPSKRTDAHNIAREKAIELLEAKNSPIAIELLSSQKREPQLGERGKIERWMRSEFLNEVILPQKVHVHMYYDGCSFFENVMRPQLEQHGFELLDTYVASAKSEILRVKHPGTPGKIVKIPWMVWVREMMGGGYSALYAAALFMTYLQKMQAAIEGAVGSAR